MKEFEKFVLDNIEIIMPVVLFLIAFQLGQVVDIISGDEIAGSMVRIAVGLGSVIAWDKYYKKRKGKK
ncbi:MAG: hypothetical protein K0Q47_50 [Sedimentibacter sp.]|jgi:membrane protein DedA with SNARE-associated domain|nr:hypothetical protein [Sedimentibacter sp.]